MLKEKRLTKSPKSLFILLFLFFSSTMFAAHDYRNALYLTTYYYGAQRCGTSYSWLFGACHVKDSDGAAKIDGGWHDCGDHVKWMGTGAYACGVLLEGYLAFSSSYEDRYQQTNSNGASDGIPDIVNEAKVYTDFLLKALSGGKLYDQIGNFGSGTGGDHKHFSEPHDQSLNYTSAEGGESDGPRVFRGVTAASNLAGKAAASLALMAIAYKNIDLAYATQCYNKAKDYFTFGDATKAVSSSVQGSYYTETNWADDMSWGAIAIYRASVALGTPDTSYRTKAITYADDAGFQGAGYWVLCWDHTEQMANYGLWLVTGDTKYSGRMKTEVDKYKTKLVNCTSGSYMFFGSGWGELRYGTAAAFVCMLYNKNVAADAAAVDVAKKTIDYVLGTHSTAGDAPAGRSFVVGYSNPDNVAAGWVQHPHHRGAFGKTKAQNADQLFQNEKASPGSVPYTNVLKGSMMGGLTGNCSTFTDNIDSYQWTEGGIDYNAGIVGAIAGLVNYLNPPTPTYSPTQNLSMTRTYTPTVSPTYTITPIPPATHKLNLEIKSASLANTCGEQAMNYDIKITNYDSVDIDISTLKWRVWLNTAASIVVEKYDSRIFDATGTGTSNQPGVASSETAIGSICSLGGKTANKYIDVTFTGAYSIPANGGYLYMKGVVRTSSYANLDPECDDYSTIPGAWAAYTNSSTFTLYEGTNLVCEYLNSTTQDTANTGINPCTGATGCPGATTKTNTPTAPTFTATPTRTNTPVPTPTSTATRTNTPVAPTATHTSTRTVTLTNTPQPPTYTFTSTLTNTPVQPTATFTATKTNSPVPPTSTFTLTRTNTPLPTDTFTPLPTVTFTSTFTASKSATPTPTPTVTRTSSRTATPTVSVTSTKSITPTLTITQTHTASPTETDYAGTPTDTWTSSATPTITQTHTGSPTETWSVTDTYTATPTFTSTDLPTETNTPVNTATMVLPSSTNTPVSTATDTPVDTPVYTATNTQVNTPVNTFTNTPVDTQVSTATNTPVNTPQNTPVNTATATKVPTMIITPTFTRTAMPTAAETPTNTPITAATKTDIEIIQVKPFPNPYSGTGDMSLGLEITRAIKQIDIYIYTSGSRLVRHYALNENHAAGYCVLDISGDKFNGLAKATYYMVVKVKADNNKEAVSGIEKITILK